MKALTCWIQVLGSLEEKAAKEPVIPGSSSSIPHQESVLSFSYTFLLSQHLTFWVDSSSQELLIVYISC